MVLCFALANSDRQALSANRLPGNQLTGLHSTRCFYHFSSPIRRRSSSGGISARHTGSLLGCSRLEISVHHAPLRGAL
ncbi:hypothetical protein PBY51_013657 [Eleginops maclovinus]|uniref:Uncharacterized protein n=1 Tax=Eleginops maclovinus TaxID=56733 RepID=A0AAN8AXZ8_ELEMC|nr:hypothetical protein PBY51_013657 [Eleginops maclovinus]